MKHHRASVPGIKIRLARTHEIRPRVTGGRAYWGSFATALLAERIGIRRGECPIERAVADVPLACDGPPWRRSELELALNLPMSAVFGNGHAALGSRRSGPPAMGSYRDPDRVERRHWCEHHSYKSVMSGASTIEPPHWLRCYSVP